MLNQTSIGRHSRLLLCSCLKSTIYAAEASKHFAQALSFFLIQLGLPPFLERGSSFSSEDNPKEETFMYGCLLAMERVFATRLFHSANTLFPILEVIHVNNLLLDCFELGLCLAASSETPASPLVTRVHFNGQISLTSASLEF